jgi:protein O-mannosyl-transferase
MMNQPSVDHSADSGSVAFPVHPSWKACFGSPAFRQCAVCLVLFCGTLLLFSRAVGHSFVDCDDPDYVTGNVHVQAGLTWAGMRWAFTSGDAANWFPLTRLSHMLDWQLFGSDPRGHHAVNVLWHALNAVLAFLALRRLTGLCGNEFPVSSASSSKPDAGGKTAAENASARPAGAFWTSAVSAALFAWHPLRVESVAWVAERKDVLSVFFGLLTLWAYAVYVEERQGNKNRATRFYVFTLAAFAAGLMCKPMLVTLPFVLLLLDWWPLQRVSSFKFQVSSSETHAPHDPQLIRHLMREKLPFFLLTVASCIVTYQVQKTGHAVVESLGLGTRFANAVVSVAGYLGKFFWPFNLAVGYPLPAHRPVTTVAGSALLLLVITGMALWQWRRRPWLPVGWFWFLGMLVPVVGVVQVGMQAMADRYTYLPVLGLQLALLWTVSEAASPLALRRFVLMAAALMLVACAARTWNQLGVWRNSNTLYEHALAVTKDNYLVHSYLATTLLNEGRFDEACSHFRRAIEIKPDYAVAHHRLGVALEKMGRTNEALTIYLELLKIRPNFAAAHYNVGIILLNRNQPAEAMAHFQAALRVNPNHDSTLVALGMATAQLGRLQEAIADYEKALASNPFNAEAYYNCANALVSLNRDQEALERYEKALQLNPDFEAAHCNYANLLQKLGRPVEAFEHYRRAIQLQPKDANAHFELGVALEGLGQTNEALASYTRAAELKPDYADAQYNIGVILLNQNQPAEAMTHFQAATRSQPDYTAAQVGVGLAAEQLGRFSEAVAAYEQALRLEPNLPGLPEKLAEARRGAAAEQPKDKE